MYHSVRAGRPKKRISNIELLALIRQADYWCTLLGTAVGYFIFLTLNPPADLGEPVETFFTANPELLREEDELVLSFEFLVFNFETGFGLLVLTFELFCAALREAF
jgi:hypothetical protein